ncbi:MAG: anhydro-N-acetylmuramic acid kinase [Pseudomonadota bacterium]
MSDSGRWALGLMSGTSMDGIDAALLRCDGHRVFEFGPHGTYPYPAAFRTRLKSCLGGQGPIEAVERELTDHHAQAVDDLLKQAGRGPRDVDVIGFHGHTILHEPEQGKTWQIGDGLRLAERSGIDVVYDFRSHDVAAGGEGAPFAPLFHAALAADLEKPIAVLNIGGVANVTVIAGSDILAFDTGPGNALIDDWMERGTGTPIDRGGKIAQQGRVDRGALNQLLADEYFGRPVPKSLDRDHFSAAPVDGLSLTDGAATLTAFTAASVALAADALPHRPKQWLVTGGGRHNPAIMAALQNHLGVKPEPVEAAGWNGDALEAQAFAYLAVRSQAGLPLSLPGTTGVAQPTCGGRLCRAAA